MAPIKFEEHIKDKLEKRTIEPSNKAWNTVADRLDAQEKKPNKMVWWIGIAASIIGVLFIGNALMNPTEPTTKAVDIKVEDVKEKPEHIIIDDMKIQDAVVETNNEQSEFKDVKNENISNNDNNKSPQVATHKQKPFKKSSESKPVVKSAIAQVDDIAIERETTNELVADEALEELNVQEVVAQIQELKATKSNVSDAEIDKLLNKAEKRIRKQQDDISKTHKVNATVLLQDVEEGIEHSFRDKVFEVLKTGYGKVKTAVAERNN